ncbi:gel scht [Massilia cavernae]|nr:gel scht [Massilia cavernae]
MRTLSAIAFAAATSFAFAAHAAPAEDTSVPVPGKTTKYKLDSEDFKYYKGSYVLSNGKTLTVHNRATRFYAQVEGERAVELIPVGVDVFMTPDADTMYVFDQFHEGGRRDVVIAPRNRQLG